MPRMIDLGLLGLGLEHSKLRFLRLEGAKLVNYASVRLQALKPSGHGPYPCDISIMRSKASKARVL